MDPTKQEDPWAVWTVQARHFAKRENYTDAVARMTLVRDSIHAALGKAPDEEEHARIQRHLARAEEQLATLKAQYDAWRSEIAARRQHTISHAAEEMARPLPTEVE